MGASHGKSKKEQKEEARFWAETKDTEITTLYGENTKLVNEMRLLHVDIQTMKRTMDQQLAKHEVQLKKLEEQLEQQKAQTEAAKEETAMLKQKLKHIVTAWTQIDPKHKTEGMHRKPQKIDGLLHLTWGEVRGDVGLHFAELFLSEFDEL